MKKEIVQQIVDMSFPVAKTIIVDDGKPHHMMLQLFRVNPDGRVELRQNNLLIGADMQRLGVAMRNIAAKIPENYIALHLSEVWYIPETEDQALIDLALTVGARNMASRKEGLSMHFFGADWEMSCIHPIHRNPLRLEKGELLETQSVDGNLALNPRA